MRKLRGLFARRFGYDMLDSPDDALPRESIAPADQGGGCRRRPHLMCCYGSNEALMVAPRERPSPAVEEWLADAACLADECVTQEAKEPDHG